MQAIVSIIKYLFVAGVAVDVALILRALIGLARAKAHAAAPALPAEE